MKEPFVNREAELAALERAFASKDAELVVMYGRRRVGKTVLLQHFAAGSSIPVLYHVGVQTTVRDELARLSRRLAEFFTDPLLDAQPLTSWQAAWTYVGQQARRRSFGLVLDEFPYLVEGDPSLPSLLQAAWDGVLRHTRLKLVLCGSSLGMMEDLLRDASPLYGRRTAQWKVQPFSAEDLALLWPARNLVEALEAYGVVGGTPTYIARLDPRKSLLANIQERILTKGSLLYEEVPFLLREEVRDARVYQAVLSALALGSRRFSELSSKTGLDRAHLVRYLSILADLELVRRDVPVTEPQPEKSRKGIYDIRDPFVAFWYRFVFPHRDRLEGGGARAVMEEVVRPGLHDYLASRLEPAVGSLFASRWRGLVPFAPSVTGKHWSESEEFDWVILDAGRRAALVVEVKWGRKPDAGQALMRDLKQRTLACKALAGCDLHWAVVSRRGFADRPRSSARERFIDLRKERARRP
jgi:AAA+ ATPase superfamily predicted ATPase